MQSPSLVFESINKGLIMNNNEIQKKVAEVSKVVSNLPSGFLEFDKTNLNQIFQIELVDSLEKENVVAFNSSEEALEVLNNFKGLNYPKLIQAIAKYHESNSGEIYIRFF